MRLGTILFGAVALAAGEALAAYPTISNLSYSQRWPVASDVDVYFTVNDDGDTCDFDLVATWTGNADGKTIGAVFAPGPGRHHYVWHTESQKIAAHDCSDVYDPERWKNCTYRSAAVRFNELQDAPLENFRVEVRPAAISGRMFLSVSLKTGEVKYGATSPLNMSASASGNQTDCLVFRRVRAKDDAGRTIVYTNGYSTALNDMEFPMKDGTWKSIKNDSSFTPVFGNQYQLREVTFSSDYFISVVPSTSGELHYMFRNASLFVGCNSVRQRSYNNLRGTVSQGINWPYTGFKVDPGSDIAQFRKFLRPMLGNLILDLPTRAQLETAMRAGTDGNQMLAPDPSLGVPPITTALAGDGQAISNVFNRLCVWKGSVDGKIYAENDNVGRAGVNAWGLYDATGLQSVWVLDTDWKANDAGLDPVGYWLATSTMSDTENRQTMSIYNDGSDVRSLVPGYFTGQKASLASQASARFVLNTKDWMADRRN